MRVETERRTYESTALAVILANAQFFAGGWNVAPKATLVDGVLDIGGLLSRAEVLHADYNLVLFDFRNHGQSEEAVTTAGRSVIRPGIERSAMSCSTG